jgi:hypothetical protein
VEAGFLVARERLQRRGVRLEWFTVAWNVAEALVAIAAGLAAGSVALIGFGVDGGIEVVAASALLWRFRRARADASKAEHSRAEQRALYVVSATFFALAAYVLRGLGACRPLPSPGRLEPLLRRTLAAGGSDQLRHLRLHQLLTDPGQRLAQEVEPFPLE